MESVCKELNIISQVKFLGQTNKVHEMMMAMDVFLFPSRFEGLGLVVVEAQATGLPCVVSENVPAPDLTNRCKVIELGKSNKEFVKALLEQKDYNRKLASQDIINGGYDISCEAKKLEELYINLHRKIQSPK